MNDTRSRTLYVNRSDSRCGNCDRPATFRETTHATLLGYGPDNGQPGCGVQWEFLDTDYMNLDVSHTRPDLPPRPGGLLAATLAGLADGAA